MASVQGVYGIPGMTCTLPPKCGRRGFGRPRPRVGASSRIFP